MTKTYGTPVIGLTVSKPDDYIPKIGEVCKLEFKNVSFANPLVPIEQLEQQVLNGFLNFSQDNIHWKMLYGKSSIVGIITSPIGLRLVKYEGVVHLKAINPEPITIAIAYGIALLATIIGAIILFAALWFIKATSGFGGIIIIILIVFLIFIFLGGSLKTNKFKIAKG